MHLSSMSERFPTLGRLQNTTFCRYYDMPIQVEILLVSFSYFFFDYNYEKKGWISFISYFLKYRTRSLFHSRCQFVGHYDPRGHVIFFLFFRFNFLNLHDKQ